MLLIPCIKQADSHVNHQWSSEKHDDTQFLEHLLDVMSPHEDADCLLFRLVHATMSHPVAGKHDGTPRARLLQLSTSARASCCQPLPLELNVNSYMPRPHLRAPAIHIRAVRGIEKKVQNCYSEDQHLCCRCRLERSVGWGDRRRAVPVLAR